MLKFITALQNHTLLSKDLVDRFFSGIPVKTDAKFFTKEINVHVQKFNIVFSDYGPAGIWNEFGLEIYSSHPLKLGHNGGGMRGIGLLFAWTPLFTVHHTNEWLAQHV